LAILIDSKIIKNKTARGFVAGAFSGLILYVLSRGFIDPAYAYGMTSAAIAVLFSGIGGALGGLLQAKKK
jgi:CDP-diglyceride synthetase